MTYDQAVDILLDNMEGRYRGERSRLVQATDIFVGDLEPGPEDQETCWGVFELGPEIGGEG